jgi:aminopeptidase-like protein
LNEELGPRLHSRVRRLFPLARSLTGQGLRETLQIIADDLPLTVTEVPSGTKVLDWTVPLEWTVREAWIAGPGGERIVDLAHHPLHLVGYSRPVDLALSRSELEKHLYSLPDQPDVIPYRTTYWADNWGFCVADSVRKKLSDGIYRVFIDATLSPGSLTLGEIEIAGETPETVLISTHTCHPAMANDNCSGIAIAVELAHRLLAGPRRRYTYRIVFCPATIGAITWLALNPECIGSIRYGMVLAGLGDPAPLSWKRSRRGDTAIDRVASRILRASGRDNSVLDFSPYGYDERQYCSPGFDLAVGRLSRGIHGTYAEYHTSLDTPDFVRPEALAEALGIAEQILTELEKDRRWRNLAPYGEPQLGRRGLYNSLGALSHPGEAQMAMLWLLNQSDGKRGLLEIADRSGIPVAELEAVAGLLEQHHLLKEIDKEELA